MQGISFANTFPKLSKLNCRLFAMLSRSTMKQYKLSIPSAQHSMPNQS